MEMQYRDLIKACLEERCAKNASYSLRAFARDMGIEASQMSRVLNGKQHLSVASARLLSERLFEKERDQGLFLHLVEFETTKKPAIREMALREIEKLKDKKAPVPLQVEAFKVISDWYHVAILDLTLLSPPRTTPAHFARDLGITEIEAKLALERLEKLEMIELVDGRWKKTDVDLFLPSGPAKQSVRRYHSQMIGKSLKSVDEQSVHERYLRADTLALRDADLKEVHALMDEFSKKLQAISSRSGKKSRLYQLNSQFFNLINQKEKKV